MNLTQEQVDLHNRHYEAAVRLVHGEIHLDQRELALPGFFARRRLRKACSHFEQAIAINPTGWNSMFFMGKIEQRLGNHANALQWFLRAREFEPANTSLAKEASLTASRLGDQTLAIRIVDEAIEQNPSDVGLIVNSGLAHILGGNPTRAESRFREACKLEPSAATNQRLADYASRVSKGVLPLPKSEREIITALK